MSVKPEATRGGEIMTAEELADRIAAGETFPKGTRVQELDGNWIEAYLPPTDTDTDADTDTEAAFQAPPEAPSEAQAAVQAAMNNQGGLGHAADILCRPLSQRAEEILALFPDLGRMSWEIRSACEYVARAMALREMEESAFLRHVIRMQNTQLQDLEAAVLEHDDELLDLRMEAEKARLDRKMRGVV